MSSDAVAELEDHLLEHYESLLRRGDAEEVAWSRAVAALGRPEELAAEFRRAERGGWRWLLRAGWALFAASWTLPVSKVFMGVTIPGWWAFLECLGGTMGPIGVAGALTNVVMLRTLWRPSRIGGASLVKLVATTGACALLNASWWVLELAEPGPSNLLVGYYAWWGSFALVLGGFALRAKDARAPIALLSVR